MPVVVPVKFTYASRDLWFDPQGLDIVQADYAVCKTERGTEIGLVTADPFEVPEAELAAPLKPVLRIADDADLDRADELARRGDDAMRDFRRLVKQNGLDMKPVGVEYLFGGEKVVFYFAAEDRVDFRQLVRDLSSCFHTRVDMRQIGVRDETRLMGGFAHCGQELCCARFGGNFEPVSIRMAKEQDLPLNSTKISGVCGRLMCCLRYEFDAYKDFKGRAPKKKALIDTPLGKARIVEYNAPREQLVLRLESGKAFRVDLADMSCSDAAKKRAEEQHCACRPDCVTRDVLDRIDSADMRMALLELDRQNGVDVGDGLEAADRLVAADSGKRRRRGGQNGRSEGAPDAARGAGQGSRQRGGSGAQGQTRAQGQSSKGGKGQAAKAAPSEAEGGTQRRRRRRSGAAGQTAAQGEMAGSGSTAAAASAEQAQAQKPEGQGAARRRHRTSGTPAGQGGAATQAGQGSSRPRKHSSAAGEDASRPRKPDVPSVAEQVADGSVQVRRRRPGDGGGQGGQAGQGGAQGQGGRKAPASDQKGGQRQGQRQGSGQAQGAPADKAPAETQGQGAQDGQQRVQKKRRRRRRKPQQGGEGQAPSAGEGGGAPSSPQAPAE